MPSFCSKVLSPAVAAVSLALSSAASAQGAQDPAAAEPTFVHEFGAPGTKGSFRVKFDERGAGVVYVMMMDHYVDVAAARHEQHTPDDFMLLVWCGGNYALRVAEREGGRRFGPDLWTGRWRHEIDGDAVRFTIDTGHGLLLTKTFRHRPEQRGLSVELGVQNRGGDAPEGALDLDLGGPTLVTKSDVALIGNQANAIAQAVGGEAKHLLPAAGKSAELLVLDGQELAMAGTTNRFFGGFLFPLDDGARHAVRRIDVEALPGADDLEQHIKAHSMPRLVFGLRLPIPTAGNTSSATFGLYLGPKSFSVFGENPESQRFLPIMDVDLEPPCCGSIVVPGGRLMATTLVKLLGFFHSMVGAWGVAIMILTVLVRGCLAPLNFRMQKSMRAYGKRMAVVKPKLDKLKERYAGDQKALQQAMIQFQREHKIFPPLGGCLPIFLTMPVYIGLFTALRTAYDLRQQSFLFMPDLSQPDALFHLPFWPWQFNIMPLLWIGLMIVLQMRMPLPTDPQQREMQRIMRYTPLIFGVLLYYYASGLLVYMVTSMLWTFVESAVTKRILGPIDPDAAGLAPTPVM